MKRHAWILLALGLGLAIPGCILTSAQIEISFDLPDATGITTTGLASQWIDLNTESEYTDNKDKIADVIDLSVLGRITNNDTNPLKVELWMTPDSTAYTTEVLLKADPKVVKLWGPLSVAAGPGAIHLIDWNESATLFQSAGKTVLINETKGDGKFTVYAIGSTGTYDFSITKGALVLVLDAKK